MQPVYFSVTVIAITLIFSAVILLMMRWMSKSLKTQTDTMLTMVNLAASKDLTTFQNLQRTNQTLNPSSQSELVDPVIPMNDEALAHRLAEHYKAQGMDPNMAYAKSDDEVDFRTEFGL